MEMYLIADTITLAAAQGLGFTKINNHLSLCDSSPAGAQQISAVIYDAVAPPPVKPNHLKTARRQLVRRRRRTRRRSEDGEGDGFFGDSGEGDGPFGGGGKGWNFGSFGWSNWDWDGSSPPSPADPAFDFVYEVICWIALSNCLHFAFKKVVRIVGDPAREKMRFAPIC